MKINEWYEVVQTTNEIIEPSVIEKDWKYLLGQNQPKNNHKLGAVLRSLTDSSIYITMTVIKAAEPTECACASFEAVLKEIQDVIPNTFEFSDQ